MRAARRPRFTCSPCGRGFSSLRIFDHHQKITDGKVTCIDPATLVNALGTARYVFVRDQWSFPADDYYSAGDQGA